MHRGILRLAALLSLAAAACGASGDEAASTEDDALSGACGSRDLGDAVYRAAADPRHPSTLRSHAVDGVELGFDSYANKVSGPFLGGGKHRELVEEMVRVIDGAHHEVFLQVLTIEDGSWTARRVADAVTKVAARGVKVFVMATPHTQTGFFKRSESGDEAVRRLGQLFAHPNVELGAWNIKGAGAFGGWGLGVLHSKSIVVDGARALVMTANLEASSDPTDVKDGIGWLQMGMLVEGRAAAQLRDEAASAWSNATRSGSVAIPPPPKPVQSRSCAHAILLGRDATADSKSSADQGFLALFGAAKTLRILTPDFNSSVALDGDTYDGERIHGLEAASAHAKIRVLLPYRFDQSGATSPGQGGSNQQGANRLLAHAANRCNIQIRWFVNEDGVRTDGNGAFASHAKYTSADGKLFVLGSQNMDTQAWQESRELSVAVDDAKTTARFDREFDALWERAGKHPKGIGYEPRASSCHEAVRCVTHAFGRAVVAKDPWMLDNADAEDTDGCSN